MVRTKPPLELVDLKDYHLWDLAGVDGLQFAQRLVGHGVTKISPFQSFETELLNAPCSVLRLGEGNFRFGIQGKLADIESHLPQPAGLRVWLKPCRARSAIALKSASINLPKLLTTKPPHRLQGLTNNCAVPARLDGIAVLVWRHTIAGCSVIEFQAAMEDLAVVKAKLNC